MLKLTLKCVALALAAATLSNSAAHAFLPGARWTSTANGLTGQEGDSITLTWSIVPDGTNIPGEGVPSDLLSFFDENFGAGPGGTDLTERPWFHFFEESFDRWSQLGGVTFVYEPRDDGVTHGTASGSRNRRGDVRIGGAFVDGPGGTLAYNQLPNGGDMVLDTGDANFFKNSSSDYVRLRNVIMHELGHGLGFNHVTSSTDALLLEPTINASFFGPQLDEIRGIQYYYGDVYEKSHNGLGNNTAIRATDLGRIAFGSAAFVGADADAANQRIEQAQTDFVSIDHVGDVDVFSFTIDGPALLDAVLTPRGGVFNQGAEGQTPTTFDANARADLQLEILDINGSTVLGAANLGSLGAVEEVLNLPLLEGGAYFARVSSFTDTIQLYQLDLAVRLPAASILAADFNADGAVDQDDFIDWQLALGAGASADADGDGDSDGIDFLAWQKQFGSAVPANVAANTAARSAPEPTTLGMAALAAIATWAAAVRRQRSASILGIQL